MNKNKLTVIEGSKGAKTKSKTLTGKQLCFVDQIVSGQSQTEAYKHCYNTSRMSAPTIHSRAYELRHDGEITARIETELAIEGSEAPVALQAIRPSL